SRPRISQTPPTLSASASPTRTLLDYGSRRHEYQVPPQALAAHTAWVKGQKEVVVLMLLTMDQDIQQNLAHLGAYDMLQELKAMYSKQAEQELLQTVREFHTCKHEEGQSVSSHVLKMKGYIDNLERLGQPVGKNLGVSRILVSLNKDFDSFVQNYNMHGMGNTMNELHAMLKLHEESLSNKDANPVLHTPPSPKKDNPAKDAIYHQCGEVGHWRRNCHVYLAKLMKKKKLSQGASTSGIFTIELNSFPSKSWIYDTGCGTHICITTQGLRRSEYMSHEFLDHLKEHEIIAHRTPPYTPQNNRVSERRNQTLLDMVRSMMSQTTLPKSFWDYAHETAARILNIVPTKKVDKTPYEIWHGPSENKVFVTRNFELFESKLLDMKASGSVEDLELIQKEDTNPSSSRTRHAPDRMCLYIDAKEHELGDLDEPANYKAALLDPESKKWLDAMNVERQSMKDNDVCVLVELPPNARTVGSKWFFKKKTNMDGAIYIFKAHLVATGFTQTYGVDYEETFSPVVDIRAIRILIVIAAYYDYEIWQMGVKTAFLNGHLFEEVYMEQPEASGSYIDVLILYVDDILLMGNNIPMLQDVKSYLGRSFAMKNLHIFLGSRSTVIGSIMYAVRCTRPDVAFAQNMTSRFQQNPGEEHWTAVKNILKYLHNTKDMFLTGYVFVLNGGAVDWKSTKQSIFATSSVDAKYIAAFDASKEAVWIRKFIYGLGIIEMIDTDDNLADPFTKALAFPKHSELTRNIGLLPASSFMSRLAYEQFAAFLANVREINSQKQSEEDTLRKADEILGPENKDLHAIFERLITRKQCRPVVIIEQLDIARKITSIALSTRVSSLKSETSILLQDIAAHDDVIIDL
nr:hypothetical protein [Tanacetum cinerariifolium]